MNIPMITFFIDSISIRISQNTLISGMVPKSAGKMAPPRENGGRPPWSA